MSHPVDAEPYLQPPTTQDPVLAAKIRALQENLQMAFNHIPFNRHIGLTISSISADEIRARIPMRDELIGNSHKQILHGGVIATVLDGIGGIVAITAAYARLRTEPKEERLRRMAQLGTIDMRIDYLTPGSGLWFEGVGRVVRIGSKICATQMELRNDEGRLIATANAVYHY